MRPFAAIAPVVVLLLVVSLLVVGCSSGSSSTAAPQASQPAESQAAPSADATTAPVESVPAESAPAPSADPSIDMSALGSEFAQIQTDLQARLSEATAKMATASTPEALAEVFAGYAAALRESAEATRAADWPAAIRSDIDKLADYQDEMAGLYDDFNGDPAAIDQDRLAAIGEEMPAVVQRIAAYFGVPITP